MSQTQAVVAVVDDEETVRSALTRLLRSAGFEAVAYESGVQFLESLDTRYPDCVVLDLRMPTLSGHEVQDRLVATGRDVPVVVLTGHGSPEARERALRDGAAAFLQKPVDDTVLIDAIVVAIGRQ